MSEFEIDFECQRADYDFVPPSEADKQDGWEKSGSLVRKGELKKVRPTAKQLEHAVDLLVKCDSTQFQRVVVGIARQMGGLLPGAPREPFFAWEAFRDSLRKMFKGKLDHLTRTMGNPMAPSDSGQRVGLIGVYLIPQKNAAPRLAIRPGNLMSALELCAARMIAAGTALNTCEHCNTPFLSGGSGRTKKRGDARFCSSECRWKHHNEMRRKAKAKSKS